MDLERNKEFVSFFHYDARNFEFEEENGTPETQVNVQVNLIDIQEDKTEIQVFLNALIVLEGYVLSSALSQFVLVQGKKIEDQSTLKQEEMQELAAPLFDLLRRLTYELTEVATDEPGLKLEF